MIIEGKTIVITGGTSGIGKEVVAKLCNENQIIVIARCEEKLAKLKKTSQNITTIKADLSNATEIKAAVNKIINDFDQIDILINNAAVQYTPYLLDNDFSFESINKEIQINFTSVCEMTYMLLPLLLKESTSIILNINSGLALTPKASSAIYCATKAALNTFSISLRYQLETTNVKVFQAFLPLVDTIMTKGRGKGKISSEYAAAKLIKGIEKEIISNDIGKIKILRFLLRFWPKLAYKILKKS